MPSASCPTLGEGKSKRGFVSAKCSLWKPLAVPMQCTDVKGVDTASPWEPKVAEGPRLGKVVEGLPGNGGVTTPGLLRG